VKWTIPITFYLKSLKLKPLFHQSAVVSTTLSWKQVTDEFDSSLMKHIIKQNSISDAIGDAYFCKLSKKITIISGDQSVVISRTSAQQVMEVHQQVQFLCYLFFFIIQTTFTVFVQIYIILLSNEYLHFGDHHAINEFRNKVW